MTVKGKRKHKVVFIIIALLVSIIFLHIILVVFPDGFDMPMNYEITYFGKSYYEIYSFQTPNEKKIGKEIVQRAEDSMEYRGNEEDAPETDALSYFYHWGHARPVRTETKVKLVRSVIHGSDGNVWIRYTQVWYDENDKLIYLAADVLARCHIVKDENGEWSVTKISEPP